MAELLTYKEFFEKFNELSEYQDYHACRSPLGSLVIIDKVTGETIAELCGTVWDFFKYTYFGYDEMMLMARLATTLPGLRGGLDNG